jgi:hypothetical protein
MIPPVVVALFLLAGGEECPMEGLLFLTPPAEIIRADTVPNLDEIIAWAGPGGDPVKATEAIRAIVGERESLEATSWVHLLALLGRVGPVSAPMAIRAVAEAESENDAQFLDGFLDAIGTLPPADRGPLLALAALLAEAPDPSRAAELRVRVMTEAPNTVEIPEIKLRHARWLLSIETRREEGFRLAEDLIVEGPDHPLAPEARRLLQVERAREAGRPSGPSTSGPPVPNRQ